MDYALVENQAGNFILPSLKSTSIAVGNAAAELPAGDESWNGVHLLNAPGEESYPIASFTYLLVYKEMSTSPTIDSFEKAKALVDFIAWAISDEGQVFAEELSYVPLPDEVQELNMQTLAGLTYEGEPVLDAEAPEPEPTEQESSASTTLDGEGYEVMAMSESAEVTGLDITPEQYVTVEIEGDGEIELTLPKSMIDDITMVTAGGDEIDFEISESSSSSTITFTVPEGESEVDIHGAMVVPEFGVIAALVLAVSIVGVIAYARFAKTSMLGVRPSQ
jgi:phosphate transport system permease protein/phosphate transport system substrate-binding protein